MNFNKIIRGPLQALKKVDFVVTNSSIAGYLGQLSEIRMLPNFMTMGYGPLHQNLHSSLKLHPT